MAYPGKFDHKFAIKHLQQLHFLEGGPAMILEPAIMEYKR